MAMRIILVRHGRPNMERARWISHRAFQHYINKYQDVGLDPDSTPPPDLKRLVDNAGRVFTSELQRAIESAKILLPRADIVSDPVFSEAPLASPPIPGVRLKVPAWAVFARVAWHGGYTPSIEDYRQVKRRATRGLAMLTTAAKEDGTTVLVAHGYINAIIGRMLRLRGWSRTSGSHRAEFWNAVVYDWVDGVESPQKVRRSLRRGRTRSSRGKAA
jgi:broad specificity phosphatase PhoE